MHVRTLAIAKAMAHERTTQIRKVYRDDVIVISRSRVSTLKKTTKTNTLRSPTARVNIVEVYTIELHFENTIEDMQVILTSSINNLQNG